MEDDNLDDWRPEKDCFRWLTFQQPVQKPSSDHPRMASTEVFETSLTNSSPSGVSIHQDDHFQWRNIWFSYSFSEELFKANDQLKNKQQILRISGKTIILLFTGSFSEFNLECLRAFGAGYLKGVELEDFEIPWPCMWWNSLKIFKCFFFLFFLFFSICEC